MNREDIEFLKELQHKMLTQDTCAQANPRFWVVMQEEKEYWVEENTDGIFVCSCYEGDLCFEGDLYDIGEWLKEEFEEQELEIPEVKIVNRTLKIKYKDEEYDIHFAKCLEEFLNENSSSEYSVGYYRNKEVIVQDTFFLTAESCRNHITANKHHYNETARPYAMTAWRSPEVAKLYEILEKTNWDDFNK